MPWIRSFDRRSADRSSNLHTFHRISCHEIGRGDVIFPSFAAAKDIDPGMLEETSHNTDDTDILCLSLHSRDQAADSPDDHIDVNSCLRRLSQLIDDLLIGK